jgi:hypothetical protein
LTIRRLRTAPALEFHIDIEVDFSDFAETKIPSFPVYLPREFGNFWTGFTTAIHAVTLFGKGYGELIQAEAPICPYWAEVPKHGNILLSVSRR